MKKQKNIGKVLIIIAIVLSILAALIAGVSVIALLFNIGGFADVYMQMMANLGYAVTDMSSEITIVCLELGISALVDALASIKYIKVLKMGGIPRNSTPFSQVFLQFIFGSFLACILAFIGIGMYLKHRMMGMHVTKEEFHDYRMEAMTEAINRLKELKEKGAISEEEYYETLNKILES